MSYSYAHTGISKSSIAMWEVYIYMDDEFGEFGEVMDEFQPIVDQLETLAQLGSYSEEEDDALVLRIRYAVNQADDGMESPLDEIITNIEIQTRSMPHGPERDEILSRIPGIREIRQIIIGYQRDADNNGFVENIKMLKIFNDFIDEVEEIHNQVGGDTSQLDDILDLRNENVCELEWAYDVFSDAHDHRPDRWEEIEDWDQPIYEKFMIMSRELTCEDIVEILQSEDHGGVNQGRLQEFLAYMDGFQCDLDDDIELWMDTESEWISVIIYGSYDIFDDIIDIDNLFGIEFYVVDPYE